MFFRFDKGCRIPVDLDNMFSGSCFIAGGAPSLLRENLDLLKQPGIIVISMNNTASKVPTDVWVCADKPKCYSDRILKDPKLMKFTMISRKDLMVGNKKMKELPNIYFYGATEKHFNIHNFLDPHRDMWWIKNIMPITLQIAYRLGFRKIYLIGCGFKISEQEQYSYKTKLSRHQINYNQRTYSSFAGMMKLMKPHFKQRDFEIISSTPNSLLNNFFPFVPFEDAIKEILKDFPKEHGTDKCLHSSEMSSEKYKNIEKLKDIVRKNKLI